MSRRFGSLPQMAVPDKWREDKPEEPGPPLRLLPRPVVRDEDEKEAA